MIFLLSGSYSFAVSAPIVTSVIPSNVTCGPGKCLNQTVTITGSSFNIGATIPLFSTSLATCIRDGDTSITCTLKAQTKGADYKLVVKNTDSGVSVASSVNFSTRLDVAPTVESVSPSVVNCDLTSGCSGQSVTITGTGFKGGVTGSTVPAFALGTATCSYVNSTQVNCALTNSTKMGAYKLAVKNVLDNTTAVVSTTNFTVNYPVPIVRSVSPSIVDCNLSTGCIGKSVTITGEGFRGNSTVPVFATGTATCGAPTNNGTQIVCNLTAATKAGAYKLAVSDATFGASSPVSTTNFTVNYGPRVIAVTPSSVPNCGNLDVEITAANLDPQATSYDFGSLTSTLPVVCSDPPTNGGTKLKCKTVTNPFKAGVQTTIAADTTYSAIVLSARYNVGEAINSVSGSIYSTPFKVFNVGTDVCSSSKSTYTPTGTPSNPPRGGGSLPITLSGIYPKDVTTCAYPSIASQVIIEGTGFDSRMPEIFVSAPAASFMRNPIESNCYLKSETAVVCNINTSTVIKSGFLSLKLTKCAYNTKGLCSKVSSQTGKVYVSLLDADSCAAVESPEGLSYPTKVKVFNLGESINLTPSLNRSLSNVSYGISPNLPNGLSFNSLNGTISGSLSLENYYGSFRVTASNKYGSSYANIDIKTRAPQLLSYSHKITRYVIGTDVEQNAPTLNIPDLPSGANFTVSPSLPSGIVLNSGTGVISGRPVSSLVDRKFTVTLSSSNYDSISYVLYYTPDNGVIDLISGATLTGDGKVSLGGNLSSYLNNNYFYSSSEKERILQDLSSGEIVELISRFSALKQDGTVVHWGQWKAPNLTGVRKVFSSSSANVALKNDGTIVAWGNQYLGGDIPAWTASLLDQGVVVDVIPTQWCNSKCEEGFAAIMEDGSVVRWGTFASRLDTHDEFLKNVKSLSISTNNGWGPTINLFKGDKSVSYLGYVKSFNNTYSDISSVFSVSSYLFYQGYDNSLKRMSFIYNGGTIPLPNNLSGQVEKITSYNSNYNGTVNLVVLMNNGTVKTWLENAIVSSPPYSSKTAVDALSNVVKIVNGPQHIAALKGDGSVSILGTPTSNVAHISPSLMSGVVDLISNGNAVAALKSDGSVVTWGLIEGGGDSSSVSAQLTSGVYRVIGSENGYCFRAMKNDGSIVKWGGASCAGLN